MARIGGKYKVNLYNEDLGLIGKRIVVGARDDNEAEELALKDLELDRKDVYAIEVSLFDEKE